MKKLFVSLFVALCATATFAQSSLLATLSHEGNITSYYGTNALKEAVAAAANGDVITLSSGQFNAVDIEKSITVRGACMDLFSTSTVEPTVVTGDFRIIKADNLYLEGLNMINKVIISGGKTTDANFIKCRIGTVERINGGYLSRAKFLHCCIVEGIDTDIDENSVQFINSIIGDKNYKKSQNCEYNNCLLTGKHWYFAERCSFKNCVIWTYTGENNPLYGTNTFFCNLFVSDSEKKGIGTSNYVISTEEAKNVFVTPAGDWNGAEYSEMQEGAFAKYPGTDGKGVGIYGGSMPFSYTPTNPQITKFNVASKSTADGKLSVDITVVVPE